ncbi:hypothetical protein [Paraburkholderia strydomiana]
MRVYASRASVAAGDDCDAPHGRTFDVADDSIIESVIAVIVSSGYLPTIAGGQATWSVSSLVPLAVVSQGNVAPVILPAAQLINPTNLDMRGGELHLHFSYHTQLASATVGQVLGALNLRAFR